MVVVGSGIAGFVGANGAGKSLAAVALFAVPAFRDGRRVVSNMHLYPDEVGCDPALFVWLRSSRDIIRIGVHNEKLDALVSEAWPAQYRQALMAGEYAKRLDEALAKRGAGRGPVWVTVPRLDPDGSLFSLTGNGPCLLLLDEITACFPARSSASMPTQLQRILNQLRKAKVQLVWTAPNWRRADVILREVTKIVYDCSGMFPSAVLRDRAGNKVGRCTDGWPPNRLFRWVGYDAMEFDDFTFSVREKAKPRASHWYLRSRHVDQWVYDTEEEVALLDHIDEFGTCFDCGGTRKRPGCRCERRPEVEAEATDGRSPVVAAADLPGSPPAPDHRSPTGPIRAAS